MAVSKLWPVTVRLATVLDYASNPEKTTKSKSKYSDADYQALRDVVNYVKNGEKTEQELFCEGINCTSAIAREQFVTVKEQFDKTDGIQAYHGYFPITHRQPQRMKCPARNCWQIINAMLLRKSCAAFKKHISKKRSLHYSPKKEI